MRRYAQLFALALLSLVAFAAVWQAAVLYEAWYAPVRLERGQDRPPAHVPVQTPKAAVD